MKYLTSGTSSYCTHFSWSPFTTLWIVQLRGALLPLATDPETLTPMRTLCHPIRHPKYFANANTWGHLLGWTNSRWFLSKIRHFCCWVFIYFGVHKFCLTRKPSICGRSTHISLWRGWMGSAFLRGLFKSGKICGICMDHARMCLAA